MRDRHLTSELEGIYKFNRKKARLLGQILRACPVAGLAGVAGLCEKTSNFIHQVLLRGIELLALSALKILFRCAHVVACFALVACLIARRELR